ncbi:MAG: hypothetical protein ACR2KT_07640 [Methylocella sp.]
MPLTGLLPKAPDRQHPGAAPKWRPVPLPAGLAFLAAYGASPALLLLAAAEATPASHRAGGRLVSHITSARPLSTERWR